MARNTHHDRWTPDTPGLVTRLLREQLDLEWQKQQAAHTPIWRGDISQSLFLKHFSQL
ncbi:hypothetical protein [Pseudomonas yamanorum]|uniref:Uncharacterized protein n=1 Tax=Pseudomonas yamanorum TaxID=515393 RepID=A0A7Y8JQ45_9PSED|nr:hypothetical protein [Pseudomonas yamanorum]NWE14478.1 hypothetical protein [Pseudomonas yamanorum]